LSKRKPEPQTPPLAAADIVRLLAERHREDVFVPECKNGPTHSSSDLLRLDAWAMPKSWAHHTTIGYEVKVSRADFEQDQKYLRYRDYCHQLFLVCPAGLIKAVDLPRGVGLVWASVNGKKLFTKVPSAKVEPPPDKLLDLIYYVLMCRTRVVRDMHQANRDEVEPKPRDELYREWIERAEEDKALACFVNAHVRARFAAQEEEHTKLREQHRITSEFRTMLEEAGVPWPETHWSSWEAKRQLAEKLGEVDHRLLNDAERVARHLLSFVADNRKPVALEETGT
jgi:hypothetical protein